MPDLLHLTPPHPGAPDLGVLHLGGLHPYEQALTVLLAFGPFVLLGFVLWWRSRTDAHETEAGDEAGDEAVDEAVDGAGDEDPQAPAR